MKNRALSILIVIGWIAFWFWAFSFAFSDSFFRYNLHSRLPTFFTALVGVSAIPLSALLEWRQVVKGHRSPLAGFAIYLLITIVSIVLPLAVAHVLARAPQPWHLEADDAMGVGIYLAALFLVATLSVIAFSVALLMRRARRSNARPGHA